VTSRDDSPSQSFFQKNKVLVAIIGAVVVLFLLYQGFAFLMHNSVTNAGNKQQQDLVADMKFVDSKLSNCFKKTQQSVSLAKFNVESINKIVTNAVTGRYNKGGAQVDNGKLFSAIQEAYPNTSDVSKIQTEVLIVINGCQTDFTGAQDKLSADVAQFKKWKGGSWKVRTFGGDKYPTSDMEIATFDQTGQSITLNGKDALRKMNQLILTGETSSARGTGTQDNSDLFDSK
jgi:hypothetical protein